MKKILTILIFALGAAANGATYYVAKKGNDTNPGSRTLPWLTITKAENTMIAGDTAYVMELYLIMIQCLNISRNKKLRK